MFFLVVFSSVISCVSVLFGFFFNNPYFCVYLGG